MSLANPKIDFKALHSMEPTIKGRKVHFKDSIVFLTPVIDRISPQKLRKCHWRKSKRNTKGLISVTSDMLSINRNLVKSLFWQCFYHLETFLVLPNCEILNCSQILTIVIFCRTPSWKNLSTVKMKSIQEGIYLRYQAILLIPNEEMTTLHVAHHQLQYYLTWVI